MLAIALTGKRGWGECSYQGGSVQCRLLRWRIGGGYFKRHLDYFDRLVNFSKMKWKHTNYFNVCVWFLPLHVCIAQHACNIQGDYTGNCSELELDCCGFCEPNTRSSTKGPTFHTGDASSFCFPLQRCLSLRRLKGRKRGAWEESAGNTWQKPEARSMWLPGPWMPAPVSTMLALFCFQGVLVCVHTCRDIISGETWKFLTLCVLG